MSAYNLSMARKRNSKSQGGQPKKQKTDPDVKIRNSKSQKKLKAQIAENISRKKFFDFFYKNPGNDSLPFDLDVLE